MTTKFDDAKVRWDLMPWRELKSVADVMTFGAKKYAPHNWQTVSSPQERYFSAAMRHITAWANGYAKDKQSNRPHLAHAVCCLLFLMWFDNLYNKGKRHVQTNLTTSKRL